MSNSVLVHFRHWNGNRPVFAHESEAIVISGFTVNGHEISSLVARLTQEGPVLFLEVAKDDDLPGHWDEVIEGFRSHFGPDQYEESTTDDRLQLFVSHIEFEDTL